MRDNTGSKSSYQGFLLSLVYSMGFQDGRVHFSLNDLHEQSKKAQPKAQPSNLNLENTLKTMVDDFVQKNHEICIVIDALDECTNQSLVSELIESISDHIWVVITSRNQPKYAETTGSRVISLDNNFKLNQDIDLYLEARLGTLAFRHNLHAEIKDALEEKVNGV